MSEEKTLADYLPVLAAEFGPDEVEFLPRAASGGMALGLPYIDARDVMRRLDSVVGAHNWTFAFDVLSPDGKMVRGKLTVLGVTKEDAGEASQEDEPLKSAVSDSLKRCAVHFGIGRYLYYLPRVWAPFDPQKRRFIEQPRLDPAAVRRALALCGVGVAAEKATVQQLPSGPMASREEAQRNRAAEEKAAAPAPESQGDRRATQSIPTPPSQPAGERRSPWAAGVTTPEPGRSEAKPPASAPHGPARGQSLACVECAKPLTRGQYDLSRKHFGRAFCPVCQKQQTRLPQDAEKPTATPPAPASGPPKDDLASARAGYMAALAEVFGKLDDPTRYAIEAVLLGDPEPLKKGYKDDYTPSDWRNFRDCVKACNPQEVRKAAEAMVNVNRSIWDTPAPQSAPSGLKA